MEKITKGFAKILGYTASKIPDLLRVRKKKKKL